MKKLIIFALLFSGCFQSTKYDCTKTDLDKTLKVYEICMKKVEGFVSEFSNKGVVTYSLSPACMQQAKELTCIPMEK